MTTELTVRQRGLIVLCICVCMYVYVCICMYVRIALTAALNPSAVEGTRIIFSPLIWAESQI